MYNLDCSKLSLISLGSNIGDRERYIATALQEIACIDGIEIVSSSKLMYTEPVGVKDQEMYLNQLLLINTTIFPDKLLRTFKNIEAKMGRDGRRGIWAPREIDIDIVFYEGVFKNAPDICVPHPQFFNRRFLMLGAMELIPDYVVDGTEMTVKEVYNEIRDTFESQYIAM